MRLGRFLKRQSRRRYRLPTSLFLTGVGATTALLCLLVFFLQAGERAQFRKFVDKHHGTLSLRLAGIKSELDWLMLLVDQADTLSVETFSRVFDRSDSALTRERLYVLAHYRPDGTLDSHQIRDTGQALPLDETLIETAVSRAFQVSAENGVAVISLTSPHQRNQATSDTRLMVTNHRLLADGTHLVASIVISPLQMGLDYRASPTSPVLTSVELRSDGGGSPVMSMFSAEPRAWPFDKPVIEIRPLPDGFTSDDTRLSYQGRITLASPNNLALLGGSTAFGLLFSVCVAIASAAGGRRSHRLARVSSELQEANQALNTRIAETEALNQQLVEAHRNYRDIFENAIEGLFQIAPNGRFVQANPACARILGFETVDALMAYIDRPARAGFFAPTDQEELFRLLAKTDQVQGYEIELFRPDGSKGWVSVSIIVVRTQDGNIRFYEGIIEDISLRKQTDQVLLEAKEEAELANRTKTQFLANMSHELRTPLNAIIGFSEIIRRQMFGPVGSGEYVEYARDIHESGEHLLELINDILDVSRVEAGKRELQESSVDLRDVIHGSLRLLRDKADAKNLSIEVTVDPCLNQIWAEELALKQILINLVSNAVKFTKAGGEIHIKAQHDTGTGIVFSVADTGVGIDQADIGKVTEPFAQADRGTTRETGGTGLGLALVKSLTELHGGQLLLESELGVGTTVRVVLPEARLLRAVA